ncbi:NAD(P)/FAD-dependent oxidoreductase [Loktanella sp. M215]|uniref:NAD(P)/FAD-dependent oxidoreductase n=1 Tax=Loktanella sp. M215 TaxID=2675431 RepID=UPI001F2FD457|nr:FAD-dependent oxidoreductase [Loktanella sp. M215]MCF7702331.1 NAD(P)-binding protein [Loktanella sp. M215]
MTRVAIIGAGMTGLACARRLMLGGVQSTLFDKGRGIGGRVATRRAAGLQFDHGAQYVTAKGTRFSTVMNELRDSGDAAHWADGTGRDHVVGAPGMSALPKALAAGLEVRQSTHVTSVQAEGPGWRLQSDQSQHEATHVVITVPAPQMADLLGAGHPLVEQIGDVRFSPCLTLMAAVAGPAPFLSRHAPDDPLAWIAQDSSKPGRSQQDATAWVAQAGVDFSTTHLEHDKPQIAALMLPLLCDSLGVMPDRVTHAVAHRWRYARVTQALGQPFVHAPGTTLYLGGDWCIGPRVEDAWTSGTAIAEHVLGTLA